MHRVRLGPQEGRLRFCPSGGERGWIYSKKWSDSSLLDIKTVPRTVARGEPLMRWLLLCCNEARVLISHLLCLLIGFHWYSLLHAVHNLEGDGPKSLERRQKDFVCYSSYHTSSESIFLFSHSMNMSLTLEQRSCLITLGGLNLQNNNAEQNKYKSQDSVM